MRTAVLCPTRDRPSGLKRMTQSVEQTSANATVLSYVDDDQREMYADHLSGHPIDVGQYCMVGPRIGPVASCNRLVEKYRGQFDVFGILTDDCVVTTPGWDEYVTEVLTHHPYCVVSPYHNFGNHVDMPFVSRRWIEATGWYACPDCYHYCWTIITGLIGEMTAICHCPMQSFGIEHEVHQENKAAQVRDAQPFFEYVSLKMPVVVERIRNEICALRD